MIKRFATKFLIIVGVLSLLHSIFRQAHFFLFDYVERARLEFDTPEAIQAITLLYEKIESNPTDPSLKKITIGDPAHRHPNVCRIPKLWLPEHFSNWSLRNSENDAQNPILEWGDVIAYFDKENVLEGIEFYQSRYGCFASRNAMKCPPSFTHAVRIATHPIYVIVRDYGG